MDTTRVFTNGKSQAVRIPKAYRFDVDEVFINKVGDTVMLTPITSLADTFDRGIAMVTEDFFAEGLPDSLPSGREEL